MSEKPDEGWLPLDEAATLMGRKVDRIKSEMRNGRIQRGIHFRSLGDGKFEVNVAEYRNWFDAEKERRKLPFIERVRLDQLDYERDLQKVGPMISKPKPAPVAEATGKRKPKLIPVTVWAEETFGDYAPAHNTLYNWIKNGRIHPMPTKVGRRYFCSPDAEYFDPVVMKIRRMTGGS